MNYDTGQSGEPPGFDGRFWWLKAALFYVWVFAGLPVAIGLVGLFLQWRF